MLLLTGHHCFTQHHPDPRADFSSLFTFQRVDLLKQLAESYLSNWDPRADAGTPSPAHTFCVSITEGPERPSTPGHCNSFWSVQVWDFAINHALWPCLLQMGPGPLGELNAGDSRPWLLPPDLCSCEIVKLHSVILQTTRTCNESNRASISASHWARWHRLTVRMLGAECGAATLAQELGLKWWSKAGKCMVGSRQGCVLAMLHAWVRPCCVPLPADGATLW